MPPFGSLRHLGIGHPKPVLGVELQSPVHSFFVGCSRFGLLKRLCDQVLCAILALFLKQVGFLMTCRKCSGFSDQVPLHPKAESVLQANKLHSPHFCGEVLCTLEIVA